MIAISYRREDSTPVAGRLQDRLSTEFGVENVFMDFDSIPYGVDFREHIKRTLERADVVVAVVGPAWLGRQGEVSRRIDDPSDFVRLEIAGALQRGIPVIPILVDNTPMPKPDALPAEIQGFAFRNALVPVISIQGFGYVVAGAMVLIVLRHARSRAAAIGQKATPSTGNVGITGD